MNTKAQSFIPGEYGQRRVVCAANLYSDGTLVLGPRHHDAVMRAQISSWTHNKRMELAVEILKESQGFIDQFGVFMDRKEALKVALESGQRIYRCGGDDHQLYSENLY